MEVLILASPSAKIAEETRLTTPNGEVNAVAVARVRERIASFILEFFWLFLLGLVVCRIPLIFGRFVVRKIDGGGCTVGSGVRTRQLA